MNDPMDPRITIITQAVKRITGSDALSAEALVQLMTAAGADERCRKALVGLIYASAIIADRLEAEAQAAELEPSLRASLPTRGAQP